MAAGVQIALLRGINVAGQKSVEMARLRSVFSSLGFQNISTYVQSGNVVFSARSGSTTAMRGRIEAAIAGHFGFEVPVLLRTAEEMRLIVKANPFAKERALDPARMHIMFLDKPAPARTDSELKALAAPGERWQATGKELYLYCPDGYGRSKLSNRGIETKLDLLATTRNWKTTQTLLEMASKARGTNPT